MDYNPKDIAGKLAKTFLHNPLTFTLGIFLLVLGYVSLEVTPREEDPQIAISGGSVIVAMPGANAKQIENIIVRPLEQKMKEVKGVEHIYGIAMDNVGVVNVMYQIGENREISNLKLYDKVMQNMDLLPKTAMQPLVKPFDIDIDIPIVSIAFYLKNHSKLTQTQLYKQVKDIQEQISKIENVAKTNFQGQRKEQFNIEVDLGKLSAYHISLGQVVKALESVSVNLPDIKGRTKDDKLVVFGVKNAIKTIKDVQNIIIANYMGSPVYLKYIANITKGIDIQNFKSAQISIKNENGKFSTLQNQITLNISKLKGTNAVVIANNVKKTLNQMSLKLEKSGIGYTITRNYGQRANEAVNELVHHLVITIVIIAIVLVLFLGWKESLIVTFTVPAILAITLFIAYLTDQSINRITLFAFLLSLGLLVDAAIIVIENIHRHLHSKESKNKSLNEIMVQATDEIGSPTNVATIAIILTMIPMGFVGGMMGEFMSPIPANVPIALLASLVVAYIFTPYLSRKLLEKDSKSE
jgi:multidrug efflux pump subunit AcrB